MGNFSEKIMHTEPIPALGLDDNLRWYNHWTYSLPCTVAGVQYDRSNISQAKRRAWRCDEKIRSVDG